MRKLDFSEGSLLDVVTSSNERQLLIHLPMQRVEEADNIHFEPSLEDSH